MSQDVALDQDRTRAEWRLAAPALGVRWLLGIAFAVSIVFAAGVYWIRQVPAGAGKPVNDAVIEVRLVVPPEHVAKTANAASQPIEPALLSEPLVADFHRSIPEATAAPPFSGAVEAPPPVPRSAPALSATSARAQATQLASTFQKTLLDHIARFRRYPAAGRLNRLEGTVQVMFAMRRDGTVKDVWIRNSSGHDLLDAAAIDTIRKAQPLPKIPLELPDQLNILIPVAFDLPQ
jgi:protein TonB